jgi:hypothetical protein
MKALTLTQPWATLVAIGAKKVETRSWSTNYRGLLAIHAAKGFPELAQQVCFTEPFRSVLLHQSSARIIWNRQTKSSDFPLGQVIAIAQLVNVIAVEKYLAVGQEAAFGDYSAGRFAWILKDLKILETPVSAKGSLGLWNWDGGVLESDGSIK